MSYGLRVKDNSGNVRLEYTDKITRFRYSTEETAGNDDSVTLSDISGHDSVEFSIPLSYTYDDIPHDVSRSGTTISWTAEDAAYGSSCNSLIFVFLYT